MTRELETLVKSKAVKNTNYDERRYVHNQKKKLVHGVETS
jgi:hypothetical protein